MRLAVVMLLAVGAVAAEGQQIRGTIRDSVSRQPVPGAVVSLLDSAGAAIGRVITNEAGAYGFAPSALARRVRAQRLGFRPRDVPVPSSPAKGVIQLDLEMTSLPSLIEAVRVSAPSRCPIRADDDRTFALLQQARAGLLSIVVAREANPGTIVRIVYSRELEGPNDRIIGQEVRIDTVKTTSVSFSAEHTVQDYVRLGFRETVGASHFYSGPDADVLLDERFAAGYCFRIVAGDNSRPNQIGLGFDPVDRQANRIDITGALWIDTVARSLRDLEFRYLDLGQAADTIHPGGRTVFREMPNGIVVIDRWVVRSPRLVALQDGRADYAALETGGELASATWPDGTTWHAHLATLKLRVLTPDRKPAAGMMVTLSKSNYYGLADSNGNVVIENLLPGPVAVRATDRRLIAIGVADDPQLRFTAVRDSTKSGTIRAKTLAGFVLNRCAVTDTNPPGAVLLIGGVKNEKGFPAARVKVTVNYVWEKAALTSVRTGDDGIFVLCMDESRRHATFRLTTRSLRGLEAGTVRTLIDTVTVVQLQLEPGSASTFSLNSPDARVTVGGVAFDSLHGVPLSGAVVGLAGSGWTTVTDADGTFRFDNVPQGTHTFTMQHDVFGAIGLSGASVLTKVVDGREMLQLYVPSFSHLWREACRSLEQGPGVGIYFGTVFLSDGRTGVAGGNVNASWLDAAPSGAAQPRSQLTVVTDSSGAFVFCGFPRAATSIQFRATRDPLTSDVIDADPLTNERVLRRDLRLRPPH